MDVNVLIRKFSDLHYEHSSRAGSPFIPSELETDSDTVLILAGDLYNGVESLNFIKTFANRFKAVLVVLGNHDYYGMEYRVLPYQYKAEIKHLGLTNVHILQNEGIEIDKYHFFGSTFWTDMDKGNPLVETLAPKVMGSSDYSLIKVGKKLSIALDAFVEPQLMNPQIWQAEHKVAFEAMRRYVDQHTPVVLITHHPGSMLAISPEYKRYGMTNHLWASEYGDWIIDNPNVKMWFSGHTHTPHDFTIGETRFVGNPIGYPGENKLWDPISLYQLPDITS